MTQQLYNPQAVELLSTHFPMRKEPNYAWGNVMSIHQQIPYLRGLWNFATRDEIDEFYDLSGQGRTLINGNDRHTHLSGLAPYVEVISPSDISRADEAGLDILTDISIGGWFWIDNLGDNPTLMMKWGVAGQQSWWLFALGTGDVYWSTSYDGTNIDIMWTAAGALTNGAWYHICATKLGVTELNIHINGIKTAKTAGLNAGIWNGNSTMYVAPNITGKVAYCWLSAAAQPDYLIKSLYELSRPLFGV